VISTHFRKRVVQTSLRHFNFMNGVPAPKKVRALCLGRKGILDVLRQQGDLTYGRTLVSKTRLFLRNDGVDEWFDTRFQGF